MANYTGKIIVRHEEGITVAEPWGQRHELLCAATTGDASFTFGELIVAPGASRGPLQGHEAVHWLRGGGILEAWPEATPADAPVTVNLRPGTEYYLRGDVPRTVTSTSAEPLLGIAMLCHLDRPCHAHAFSHEPGVGNHLHYHGPDKWVEPLRQEFVEAMYLVRGPGSIATADPLNHAVQDYEIQPRSAVYHPLNTLHRQYNPATSGPPNFWIHAGYYAGAGRTTAGVFDLPEIAVWQRPR